MHFGCGRQGVSRRDNGNEPVVKRPKGARTTGIIPQPDGVPAGARERMGRRFRRPIRGGILVGAGSGGFTVLHHRLISMTPPASLQHLMIGSKCMTRSKLS